MYKKILVSVLLAAAVSSSALAMKTDGPNFVLLSNIKTNYLMATNATRGLSIENQAIELVKKTLNINAASPYKTVRIRLIYNNQNTVDALIVYLLSAKFKSADIVRINLTNQFTVKSIIENYQLQPEDLKQSPNYAYKATPHCPDDSVQFVVGNNFTGDESVEKEIQKVYQLAKDKGYNPVLMDTNDSNTPQPTVQAYENWLSCPNVKGFYNESHGYEQGIMLSDDDFSYSLVEKDLVNKLNHEVILFDSCVTFHDPLKSAMTNAEKGNAQQYIAGIIYLPFGPSERAASCIWSAALNHEELNPAMVENCSKNNELDPHGFGITGNGDKFLAPAV